MFVNCGTVGWDVSINESIFISNIVSIWQYNLTKQSLGSFCVWAQSIREDVTNVFHWLSPCPELFLDLWNYYLHAQPSRHQNSAFLTLFVTNLPKCGFFHIKGQECLIMCWISQDWGCTGSSNPFSWKTGTIHPTTCTQYHGSWLPGDTRSQGISSYGIDPVLPGHSGLSTSNAYGILMKFCHHYEVSSCACLHKQCHVFLVVSLFLFHQ